MTADYDALPGTAHAVPSTQTATPGRLARPTAARPPVIDDARAACGCDLSVGPNALHIVDGHPDPRPSITDNARDVEPMAWCPGCGDCILARVVRERGVCSNCYGTTDDPWAAARAETTTEQPCRHCGSCDGPPSCPDCDHADRRAETTTATPEDAVGELLERMSNAVTRLEALLAENWDASEGQRLLGKIEGVKLAASYVEEARDLLATSRTATIEDAARVLVRETTSGLCEYGRVCDECDCFADAGGRERDAHALALARAMDREGLLATARTRPTREQIITALDHEGAFCGVCGREPGDPLDDCDDCRRCLRRYADAVLALYTDQPTETTTDIAEDALDSLPYFTFDDDDVAPGEEFVRKADVARLLATTRIATIEDTARAIHRALAPRWMSVAQALGPGQDAYEAMLADIAQALADGGLLATARTHPTREQIDRAVGEVLSNASNHPDPVAVLGRSIAPLRNKITDAVLELLQDGPATHHEDDPR